MIGKRQLQQMEQRVGELRASASTAARPDDELPELTEQQLAELNAAWAELDPAGELDLDIRFRCLPYIGAFKEVERAMAERDAARAGSSPSHG